MKKLKLTIVLMSILLVSIFVGSSFEIFDSIAAETGSTALTYSLTHTAGSGLPVRTHISGPTKPSISYDKITQFPINGTIFNQSKYYFCVQHGVAYGGQYINTSVGDARYYGNGDYHQGNTATANAWGSYRNGYTSDRTADVDSSADFYVDTSGSLHTTDGISYYSYKEKGESPLDYVFTNWLYIPENIEFNCEQGDDDKTGLAFLFARYKAGDPGSDYLRPSGAYQSDPLQRAVWSSFLNEGATEDNPLQTQADAFVEYHEKSDNPNVNAKPASNVGTTLSGGTYTVGPFEMYSYVRAEDFSSPRVSVEASTSTGDTTSGAGDTDSGEVEIVVDTVPAGNIVATEASLQDIFGDEYKGTIIKAEAVVSNGATTKRVEIDIPEPGTNFSINLSEADIAGYDELEDIVFTYQRIHAYAEGIKYRGIQYRLKFIQTGADMTGCTSYDCTTHNPGYADHETGASTGGWHTCTYEWTCNDHDEGCGCAGGHKRSGCSCGGYRTNPDGSKGSAICDGHKRSGCNCACDGHSDTHTGYFLCKHKHEDCKEFNWKYAGTAGDVAQDAYAGSGELAKEVVEYCVKVEVPLKTDMTIYKYIEDVVHRATNDRSNLTLGDRSQMTYEAKEADTVKVERGDIVTYKVIIKNESRFPTKCKVKDILPSPIKNLDIPAVFEYTGGSGGTHTASEITVAANSQVEYTIKLDPDALEGTHLNRVEFISNNNGPEYFKYSTWGDDATHGPHSDGNIVNIATDHQFDGDFYTIKEYDVTVDKYIRKVNHKTNGYATFDNDGRKQIDEENNKKTNPVYAEFGDVVTYNIDIYNTCEPYLNTGVGGRADEPFWNPDVAYVDIKDTLPAKYSELNVTVSNGTGTIAIGTGVVDITAIKVPAGGKVTVTITLVVEEVKRDTLHENKAEIVSSVRNVNNLDIKNNSKKTITSDWYKIQDYNLSINKYVSEFKSDMTAFNNDSKFTTETNTLFDKRVDMTDLEKATYPVHAEKTDIITYTIIARNDATGSGLKYATQVRPAEIRDRMDDGLTFQSVTAELKNANGDVEKTVTITHTTEGANTHIFSMPEKDGEDYLILDPGDYMEYKVVVEVTKTNMYLFDLSNTASIKTLTNINSEQASRIVTTENIAPQQDSTEFVKLKDLVIAGKVWLDTDEDGFMGIGKSGSLDGTLTMSSKPSIDQDNSIEYAMEGIVVKLYEVGKTDPIRTTKTDADGLFTFARAEDLVYYAGHYESTNTKETESEQRIPKATKDTNNNYTSDSEFIDYYIEYEYDGLVYRSTEVYSYKDNLNENGAFEDGELYKIDSNAFEFDQVRKDFNEHYAIMSYNQAMDFSDKSTSVLEFEKKDHESFIREDPARVITARSFIITTDQTTDYLWLYPLTEESSYPETEYLKYINLGLEERDKLDLSLSKDLIDVELRISEYDLKYEYGTVPNGTLYYKRLNDDPADEAEGLYNLYLYRSDYHYRYEMYEHKDVRELKGEKNEFGDVESELRLDLHYQIKVKNESKEDEYVRLYEIVDYNTASMQLRSAKINGTDLKFEATSDYNKVEKYVFAGREKEYYKLNATDTTKVAAENYELNFLHGDAMEDIVLATGDEFVIDLIYTVDKYNPTAIYPADPDARSMFVDDKYNVAQIGAYAAFEEAAGTTPKGLVDSDSNAANINNECVGIDDLAKYEDNAFRVGLNIELKDDERDVKGFVFEDSRTDKLEDYNYFTGNGMFADADTKHSDIVDMRNMFGMKVDSLQDLEKDTKLEGMTVELVEIVEIVDASGIKKFYEEVIDPLDYINKTNVVVQTGADGIYQIDSFIPGVYVVRFRYGDFFNKMGVDEMTENSLIHNGQDYKSTSYVLREGETTSLLGVKAPDTSTALIESTTDNEIKLTALARENYSDARDNEYRRLEIMSNSEIMNHDMAEFLKYTNYNGSALTSGIGPFEAVDDGAAAAALTGDISGVEPTLSALTPASGVAITPELREFEAATNGFADTVTVKLEIEKRADTRDQAGESVENGKILPSLQLNLPNVDYGVVFRPENFVEMTKKIKNIKLTTLSGEVLIDLEYEYADAEDRKGEIVRKVGIQNVQSVNTTNGVQGFRYINIDEELIQGATLSVEYLMTVNNIGEVDLIAQKLIDMGNVIETNPQNLFTTTNVVKKLDVNRTHLNGELVKPNGDPNGIRVNYFRAPEMISKADEVADYEYGMFVGKVYYRGKAGEGLGDVLAPLKVSKILDFIDNDATFVQANNSVTNKFWTITTEPELLRDGLIGETGLDTTKIYLDNHERKYVTDEKNNLVYSVGTLKENPDLLKDIYPQYAIDDPEKNEADIVIQLDAVLGGDKESEDMVYDNVAEIIEFITVTGRRTNFASTVGNIVINGEVEPFESSQVEVDSDGTEVIMLTPPTGRTQFNLAFDKVKYIVALVAAVVVLIVLVYITKFSLHGKVGKSKFYK